MATEVTGTTTSISTPYAAGTVYKPYVNPVSPSMGTVPTSPILGKIRPKVTSSKASIKKQTLVPTTRSTPFKDIY